MKSLQFHIRCVCLVLIYFWIKYTDHFIQSSIRLSFWNIWSSYFKLYQLWKILSVGVKTREGWKQILSFRYFTREAFMGLHLAININDLRICIQTRDTKKQVNIENGVCKQTMIISTYTKSLKHSIKIQWFSTRIWSFKIGHYWSEKRKRKQKIKNIIFTKRFRSKTNKI